jgi:hypothetical protein
MKFLDETLCTVRGGRKYPMAMDQSDYWIVGKYILSAKILSKYLPTELHSGSRMLPLIFKNFQSSPTNSLNSRAIIKSHPPIIKSHLPIIRSHPPIIKSHLPIIKSHPLQNISGYQPVPPQW